MLGDLNFFSAYFLFSHDKENGSKCQKTAVNVREEAGPGRQDVCFNSVAIL